MLKRLEEIRNAGLSRIKDAPDSDALQEVRQDLLGKKGQLTQILKSLGSLTPEERPAVGKAAN